jgi:hypothetical protein
MGASQARSAMDQAFSATREAEMQAMGVPAAGGRPAWLIPAIVVLVLLGGIVLVVKLL